MEERTPPARAKSARSMEPSPQPSGRSMAPSRASTAGDLGGLATPPRHSQSTTPKGAARGESPRRSASVRSRAPSEGRDAAEDSVSGRQRRTRAPAGAPQQGAAASRDSVPGQPPFLNCGMEQPAFKAVLDWWENAAQVLGVTAGVVSQAEVEERLERASGMPAGRASLAESLTQEARAARAARDALRRGDSVGGSPPDNAASGIRHRSRRNNADGDDDENKERNQSEDRDGGGIPGLDFIYRLMAPRHLMEKYERLEQEVESPQFKTLSEEEQAETRQMLQETQAAIEQRENRLNIIAAAIGGLHGAYVGTMAAMLAIFVPQRCPPTLEQPAPHTCNLYENTHDLTLLNQAVLAFNAITLIMMLLTELSVFRREKWLDTTLSYNPRKAARFLSMPAPDGGPSMLQKHPYIAHQLLWQNLTAGNLARATIAMVLLNLVISSILIVGFYSDGARSVIMIVTNTMLLGAKLLWAAIICLQSKNTQQGVSLYKTMRINFNIIDANFLASEEYARCKDKFTWEEVQEELARVASAEKGDVKLMGHQAKQVLKHIVVGRQTTTALGRRAMGRINEGEESVPETPASPESQKSGTPASARSIRAGSLALPDATKASPAEENA